jgi:hypothetical protein
LLGYSPETFSGWTVEKREELINELFTCASSPHFEISHHSLHLLFTFHQSLSLSEFEMEETLNILCGNVIDADDSTFHFWGLEFHGLLWNNPTFPSVEKKDWKSFFNAVMLKWASEIKELSVLFSPVLFCFASEVRRDLFIEYLRDLEKIGFINILSQYSGLSLL